MPFVQVPNPLPQGINIVDKNGAMTQEFFWIMSQILQILKSLSVPEGILVDDLPDGEEGTTVYSSDAKNFLDDGAVVGSIAVTGGAGSLLVWLSGSWRTLA